MGDDVVESKLDLVARLLALNITQKEKTKADKVRKLNELGLDPKDVAVALGMELKRVNEIIRYNPIKSEEKK